MHTVCLPFNPESLARASGVIRSGGLVAFPTETVYGLGARADMPQAVRGIFQAKGRPSEKPLIVHVADAGAARALAASWPALADQLAAAFWPGPLTLVVPRRIDSVPDEVAAFGPTVAVRVPAHPVALALLDAAGLPIAAPSANLSGAVSPTTAAHVKSSLDGRIDMILDGGATGFGIESTIVDLSQPTPALLRRGAISIEALLDYAPVDDRSVEVPAAGQAASGNADRVALFLVEKPFLLEEVTLRRRRGERAGALDFRPAAGIAPPVEVLPVDPIGYALGLYTALHRLHEAGCTCVVAADVPGGPEWSAVRDRLVRLAVRAGGS